ncbi:MAG TPA: Panacea domain-containing protein [Flavitalea sp.]|nr:Panacea domain-containing protein [Flavitalea sp.]
MRGFNYKKSVQLLNSIALMSNGTSNKMKAIKLIWLIDRLHIRNNGRTVTGDTYFALPHGPVPSATRDLLESSNFSLGEEELGYACNFISSCDNRNFYKSINDVDNNVFSKSDIDSLHKIWELYGQNDQFELRDLSHNFPEWKKFESAFNGKVITRAQMNIEDFFIDAPPKVEKIGFDPVVLEESKHIFKETVGIENLLK